MPGAELIRVHAGSPFVSIVVTTNVGGDSIAPYGSFNIALHVGDSVDQVRKNRDLLVSNLGLKCSPVWLNQVHGSKIFAFEDGDPGTEIEADGSITTTANVPLAIMTADCLPIVVWDPAGKRLCALHAGWRGLADGIIKAGASHFESGFSAFIGPAIGPCHYEVDDAVWQHFENKDAFIRTRQGHYQFDLAAEARRQLVEAGAGKVDVMNICTACDERFYSYRRDGETGRFATLAWLRL